MRTSDWVEEREGTLGEPIELAAEGLALRLSPRRVLRARWEQVLGVAALPPERLLVLLPREPPAPPWIALELDALPPSLRERGIEGLAATIRERSQQIGYRAAPARPRLDEATLLERVIARQAVPGALEVPVGAGPRAPATVAFERVAVGAAGALSGLYLGVLAGAPLLASVVAGTALGAITPRVLAARRARRRDARVLVLAPDGCVVGLPTGPQAFAWSRIDAFAIAGEVSCITARSSSSARS
ncbi:MAG: hypothetical protein KF901_03850 [Myxococcales bacterium]|nr:hypothetical protein [Myxococcales bacterium]